MLSKEEYTPIELREHCIKTMQFSKINSNVYKEHELILSIMDENISMKYKIEQLESDKQKLIEKLEKVKQKNEEWNELNGELAVWTFAQEILSTLKGE